MGLQGEKHDNTGQCKNTFTLEHTAGVSVVISG